MLYTTLTKRAMCFAYEAHKDQVDKSGAPYIFHPIHLAEQMNDEASICVALLHDTIEDSPATLKQLKAAGFTDEIVDAVALLTHDKAVPYMEYIKKIKDNPIASRVKLADLRHNSDISRLSIFDKAINRRINKYHDAIAFLSDTEPEFYHPEEEHCGYTFYEGLTAPDLLSIKYDKIKFPSITEAIAQAKKDGYKFIPESELPKRFHNEGVVDIPKNREWLKWYCAESQKRSTPGYNTGYVDCNGHAIHTGDRIEENGIWRELIWDMELGYFRLKGYNEQSRLDVNYHRWTVVQPYTVFYPSIQTEEPEISEQER